MNYRRLCLSFAALVLIASALLVGTPSRAQVNSTAIKYGDTVTGEITNQTTQVSYTFTASKSDIVLVQLLTIPDKDGKYLSIPILTIGSGSSSKPIADSSKGTIIFFGGSGKFVAAQIDAKGDYTITVSKESDNDSTGQFTLNVTKAELLKTGNSVQGTISSKAKGVRYPAVYAVSSADDFGVQFTRSAKSKFYPSLTVHALDRAGVPVPVAYAAGNRFISTTLGVEGSKELNLVTVGDLEDDIRGDREKNPEQTADYEIGLVTLASGGKGK